MATTLLSFQISEVEPSKNKPNLPISKHPYVSLLNFYIYQTLELYIPTQDCDYIMAIPDATNLIEYKVLPMDRSTLLSNSSSNLSVQSMSHNLVSNGLQVPSSMHGEIFDSVSRVARKLMTESNGNCPGMSIDVFIEAKVTEVIEYDEFAAALMDGATEDSMEFKLTPATRSCVETLEKVQFSINGASSKYGNQSCAICMDEFEFGLEVTKLPCSHLYHGNCIVQWLETSHFCPLCRFPMPHDS